MKIYFSIFTVLICVALFGQNKAYEKQAAFFADKAGIEFKLSKEQLEEIKQSRLTYLVESQKVREKGLEETEKKTAMQALNVTQRQVIEKLTGLKSKEAGEWIRATMQDWKKKK